MKILLCQKEKYLLVNSGENTTLEKLAIKAPENMAHGHYAGEPSAPIDYKATVKEKRGGPLT